MYLVHNFQDFVTEEEVEKHIKDDILGCMKATSVADDVWKSHDGLKMYHLVLAREDSPAAARWNHKTIQFLKEQIRANRHETTKIDIVSTIKKTINYLMHQYVYLPTTDPVIPLFVDPMERIFESATESLQFLDWLETMEALQYLIKNKGFRNETYYTPQSVDPFSINVKDLINDISEMSLILANKHDVPIFYGPLGTHNEPDKSFPLKIDLIFNDEDKMYLYVVDIPGVKEEDLVFTCVKESNMVIDGVRAVPKLYSDLIPPGEVIQEKERRFNSFTLNLELPNTKPKLKCVNHQKMVMDGVLYLSFGTPYPEDFKYMQPEDKTELK